MRDAILIAVLSFTVIAVLRWVGIWGRDRIDRRKVYCWLRSKTRDEPGESHVETTPLAKATRLPEERVAAGLNVWPANPSSTRRKRPLERLARRAAERLREAAHAPLLVI